MCRCRSCVAPAWSAAGPESVTSRSVHSPAVCHDAIRSESSNWHSGPRTMRGRPRKPPGWASTIWTSWARRRGLSPCRSSTAIPSSTPAPAGPPGRRPRARGDGSEPSSASARPRGRASSPGAGRSSTPSRRQGVPGGGAGDPAAARHRACGRLGRGSGRADPLCRPHPAAPGLPGREPGNRRRPRLARVLRPAATRHDYRGASSIEYFDLPEMGLPLEDPVAWALALAEEVRPLLTG